mmetsp:Transcript_59250/g.135898  ORF Transcript_59250/g.135898 Transcript_59250/m.135898 type:complete len:217 (+) Transcript_59250:596-1246(+)
MPRQSEAGEQDTAPPPGLARSLLSDSRRLWPPTRRAPRASLTPSSSQLPRARRQPYATRRPQPPTRRQARGRGVARPWHVRVQCLSSPGRAARRQPPYLRQRRVGPTRRPRAAALPRGAPQRQVPPRAAFRSTRRSPRAFAASRLRVEHSEPRRFALPALASLQPSRRQALLLARAPRFPPPLRQAMAARASAQPERKLRQPTGHVRRLRTRRGAP